MRSEIAKVLSRKGLEVLKPLKDMFPLLERGEFLDNLLVEPMAE